MREVKGKRLGRFAFWVFVIMLISFVIAGTVIAANLDYFKERELFDGSFFDFKDPRYSKEIDDEKTD